jgi:hypothetical protein
MAKAARPWLNSADARFPGAPNCCRHGLTAEDAKGAEKHFVVFAFSAISAVSP